MFSVQSGVVLRIAVCVQLFWLVVLGGMAEFTVQTCFRQMGERRELSILLAAWCIKMVQAVCERWVGSLEMPVPFAGTLG